MDPTEVSIVAKQVVHANHQKANTREAPTSDSNDRISIRARRIKVCQSLAVMAIIGTGKSLRSLMERPEGCTIYLPRSWL